jgi:hypothetical protein
MCLARKDMLGAMKGEYSKTIVLVQAALRRALVRGRYATQLKRKRALWKIECTALIQSKFRRAVANHRWVKTNEGVLVMCARVRALQEYSHRARRNAAVMLQAAERARLQCREGAKILESGMKDKLSCVLQAFCRRYQPRKRHRETMATMILQAAIRKERGIAQGLTRRAVSSASSYARAALCRRTHAQIVGAIRLAAYMRALVQRSTWRTVDGAALRKIPAEMDALDREMEQERCSAIVCIQASIRRLLQRKSGEERMMDAKRVDSITLIQASSRRLRARRQVEILRPKFSDLLNLL